MIEGRRSGKVDKYIFLECTDLSLDLFMINQKVNNQIVGRLEIYIRFILCENN